MATAIGLLGKFGQYSTEGHFLYLFAPGVERILGDRLNPVSILRDAERRDRFVRDLTALVNSVFSATGDPADVRWIDKTPGIAQVNAIPGIVAMWPDARFIYLYRTPHEAVRSNLANWPDQLAGKEAASAERWATCQRAWRKNRSAIPKPHYVQMFQPDMLEKPRAAANKLRSLLDLSDAEVDMLANYWEANKALNRPNSGEASAAYDKVALTPAQMEAVSRVTEDEVRHWPRLREASVA